MGKRPATHMLKLSPGIILMALFLSHLQHLIQAPECLLDPFISYLTALSLHSLFSSMGWSHSLWTEPNTYPLSFLGCLHSTLFMENFLHPSLSRCYLSFKINLRKFHSYLLPIATPGSWNNIISDPGAQANPGRCPHGTSHSPWSQLSFQCYLLKPPPALPHLSYH